MESGNSKYILEIELTRLLVGLDMLGLDNGRISIDSHIVWWYYFMRWQTQGGGN